MILTFKDLRDQVLRRLDEAGDTSTTRDIVNDLLNDANRLRATELAHQFLVMDSSFATEVGRQEYALHEDFDKPLYFKNLNTRKYLAEVPDRQLQPENYDLYNDQGTAADAFIMWGRTQVWRQPSVEGTLSIVSTAAGDVGSTYQIFVRGEQASDGAMVSETISPNGLTPVPSYYSYRKVIQVTRSGAWAGTMTLTDTAAVTLLVLGPKELGKNYQQIFLLRTPTAAETIDYRFFRQPILLYNDYDQPDIPAPYSQILVYDTLLQIGGYNTDINGQALGLWRVQQERWEKALYDSTSQGQSINARARFIRPYGGDGTWLDTRRGA